MKRPAVLIVALIFCCAGAALSRCTLYHRKTPEDLSRELNRRFEGNIFHSTGLDLPYRLLRPVDHEGKRRPMIVFFHGAGERGYDNQRSLKHLLPFLLRDDVPVDDLYVLVPQCPPGDRWVETDWGLPSHHQPALPSQPLRAVLALLDRLETTEGIDPSRVYLMGLSMGGFAVWDILARAPKRFAAAVPVCGGADEATAQMLSDVPIWAFHGGQDRVVRTDRSRHMVAALKRSGSKVRYTEYPAVGHGSWVPAFQDQDLARWLFSQTLMQNR